MFFKIFHLKKIFGSKNIGLERLSPEISGVNVERFK